MPWFAAAILRNIASIGEVEPSSDGAKGLRLRDPRRARVCSSGVLVFTKKEERRKIETVHRKSKRNFKPKIRKILIGMGLFEQTLCFTTEKHVSTMNS
jgi:hypothetical protein